VAGSITGSSVTYSAGGYDGAPSSNTGSGGRRRGLSSATTGASGIVVIRYPLGRI
jgi:hypothetical protein